MWQVFLDWLRVNQIGDLLGLLGILISAFGFVITIRGVHKAESAARNATESIRLFETAVDFTAAISVMEEIKRAHREKHWAVLPDRYAAIRKVLISVRHSSLQLTNDHLVAIQNALVNLRSIEQSVEKHLQSPSSLNAAKFNAVLSDDIDELLVVLSQIKAVKTGAP